MLTDPHLVNARPERLRYSARLRAVFLYFSGGCRVSGQDLQEHGRDRHRHPDLAHHGPGPRHDLRAAASAPAPSWTPGWWPSRSRTSCAGCSPKARSRSPSCRSSASTRHKRPHDEVRELVDDVAGTFGVVLFFVTLIGVIAAPLIILAFAPGWHADAGQVATSAVVDAALDLPLSILHLAERAVLRRAQQLRQLRAAGVHAGDHERGHDRRARCGSRRTPRTRA